MAVMFIQYLPIPSIPSKGMLYECYQMFVQDLPQSEIRLDVLLMCPVPGFTSPEASNAFYVHSS